MGLLPYLCGFFLKTAIKAPVSYVCTCRNCCAEQKKPQFEKEQKMLKKITLIAAAAALLIGAETLPAQQSECGNPQPKQKQVQKGQGFGPQMFGKWLDALAKAHQENDMEKMGKLIKKMQQARQEMQKARQAVGQRHRGFRKGCCGKRHRGQFRKESGWGMPRAGMRRRGPGFDRCGFGRRSQGMRHQGWGGRQQGRGMRRRGWGDVQLRGFGRWHQGRPRRGANDPMCGMPQRGDVNELMQDMPPEEFNWD
jgi:hypothetical protein